jgi:hypothetical protein
MNFRFSAILFCVILVVLGALLLKTALSDKQDKDAVLISNLSGVKPDQIDALEIERQEPAGGTLKFQRTGKDQWAITEPIQARADGTLVNRVVEAVLTVKPTAFPGRIPPLAVTGVQPPSMKVTLRQGNERSGTLNIGNITYGASSSVFVSTPAHPDRAIAVDRTSLAVLFRDGTKDGKSADLAKWTADYRTKSVFPSASPAGLVEDVTAVKLILTNKNNKELALTRSGGGWKFDAPAGWGEADTLGDAAAGGNSFTGVRPLVSALTNLQAKSGDDFIDTPSPDELKKDGLNPDNPDLVRVELKTKDGTTAVSIGKIEAGPPSPSGIQTFTVYVRVDGQPGIVRASGSNLGGLVAVIENPDPLRNRNLLAAEKNQVDGIDLISQGQTAKLRKVGLEWKLVGNPAAGDPQNPNLLVASRIVDALTERHTIKSFPAPNPANFAPPEIKAEVKVWSDGFEPATDPKAEPKEKGKPTVLLFGKHEGDSLYVRRTTPDGVATEFVIPDRIKLPGSMTDKDAVDVLADVRKTRLDLLDPGLRPFAPSIANKFTVTGVRGWVLEKEEPKEPSPYGDRWVFQSPADKKGTTADAERVGEILRTLATTTTVTRFVEETPSEEKLVEYGLAAPKNPPKDFPPSPRLKVVVGLKGTEAAEQERVWEFGNVSGDVVYARQPGRAAVFTLPKAVFDIFTNTDLRDRAIFKFDPVAITGLEFQGWKKETGTLTTLKFEKKDGTWKATEPATYNVDPLKVDDFVRMLRSTSVKLFLPGQPVPGFGLSDDNVKLVITLKTAAGPLMTLVLGELVDNGQTYYLQDSQLPPSDPLATLDAARFKMYKDKPGVFAK